MPRNATASQQTDFYLKQADLYSKISTDYPGTSAGQRASLQGAAMLFAAGKYADAQAHSKFLNVHPGQCLCRPGCAGRGDQSDAQSKTDLAAGVYQRIINTYSDRSGGLRRFALAQIDEHQANLPKRQIFTKPSCVTIPIARWVRNPRCA